MYNVAILTYNDYIAHRSPVVIPNVKTVSVTNGRILITDNDRINKYLTSNVKYIRIWREVEVNND